MDHPYTFIANLSEKIPPIPRHSILSQTVYQDEHLRVIIFAFAPGQELSEHTSSKAAMLHFLRGEAILTLGEERFEVSAGAWAHMPPNLPHSITAKTEVRLLLTMFH